MTYDLPACAISPPCVSCDQVGFESHAHRAISDKMAETPEEVVRFLDALAAGVRDKAKQEAS